MLGDREWVPLSSACSEAGVPMLLAVTLLVDGPPRGLHDHGRADDGKPAAGQFAQPGKRATGHPNTAL